MGEPALNGYDSEQESEARYLSARERADQSWGMGDQPASEDPLDTDRSGRPDLKVIKGGKEGEVAGTKSGKPDGSAAENSDGGLFRADGKDSPGGIPFLASRRRKGIVGLLLGGFMGGGLFFGFAQGPLEFMQLAHMLEDFHFSVHEDQSDMRTSRAIRYLRDPSKPQNVRLGIIATKFADKFEAKLNASGIESQYTKTFGFGDGYVVDPANENFKDLEPDEIKAKLVGEYGVPESAIKVTGGKVSFDVGNGYRANAKFSRGLLKSVGYNKVNSWIGARLLGERAGVTWHPLRKADNAALSKAEDAFKAWQEKRGTEINEGEQAALADAEVKQEVDKDGNPVDQSGSDSAKNEVSDIKTEAASADSPGGMAAFQDHLGTKIALGGTALVGVACLAKSVNDDVSLKKQAQEIEPLIRFGVSAMSTGGQSMASLDINKGELGYLHSYMHGTDASGQETSWNDTKSIRQNLGESGGEDPSETLQSLNKGGPFDDFFAQGIGGVTIGGALKAACSTAGTIIMTAFSFATGPISTVVQGVAGYFAGPKIISFLAHWFVGKPIDALAKGADFGAQADFGSLLAANEVNLYSGGSALSSTQVAALQSTSANLDQQDFDHENFAYRMFNADDPRSMVAKVMQNNIGDANQSVASISSSLANAPQFLLHSFSSIFSFSKAHAATGSYDYGVPVFGFSQQDMEDPNVQNPYQNAKHAADLLDGPDGNTYIDRAKSCFNVDITNTDGVWDANADKSGTVSAYIADYKGNDCSDSSENWRSIRFFIFDTNTIKATACYEGDAQSCDDLGVNGGNQSSDTTSGGTHLKIATFNVRGASHPEAGSVDYRAQGGAKFINDNGFQVVGLQELQTNKGQRDDYVKYLGTNWDFWPAKDAKDEHHDVENSIAWDTRSYDKVDSGIYGPDKAHGNKNYHYFNGEALYIPWVKLQDKQTGQQFIVESTHDPAFNQYKSIRTANAAQHLKDTQDWAAQGLPVFVVGDFNSTFYDRGGGADPSSRADLPYCVMTKTGELINAFDIVKKIGSPVGQNCPAQHSDVGDLPGKYGNLIDHIYVTPQIQISDQQWSNEPRDANPRYTDHPVMWVDATIPGGGAGTFRAATYNIQHAVSYPDVGCHLATEPKVPGPYVEGYIRPACIARRSQAVAGVITKNQLDLVGLQEVSPQQQDQVLKNLPDYQSIAPVPLYHGVTVLWNTKKFTEVGSGTLRTINNISQPANLPWVKLNGSGVSMYVISVHAPTNAYGGSIAVRAAMAQTIREWAQSKEADGTTVMVMGDFNEWLNAGRVYCTLTKDGILQNTYDAAANKSSAKQCPTKKNNGIDQIYISPTNSVKVTDWEHISSSTIPPGTSDHEPAFATISTGSSSATATQAQAPTSNIDGVKNFRDAAASSNVLKSGVLYRSGQLDQITSDGINNLSQLLGQNGTIIDLRTDSQRQGAPDATISGSKNVKIPIQGINDQSPMVTDATRRAQLGKALKAAANAPGGVLIHCSAGKDRTGWAVAMIMYINGASDTQVMNEYMASQAAWPDGVKEAWLNSGLQAVKKNYGTMSKYWTKGLGLSSSDLQKIRQKFGVQS